LEERGKPADVFQKEQETHKKKMSVKGRAMRGPSVGQSATEKIEGGTEGCWVDACKGGEREGKSVNQPFHGTKREKLEQDEDDAQRFEYIKMGAN